jgi:hypothetical protein
MEKNLGEWREGVKCVTGIREELRNEDMDAIISC